MLWMTLCDMLDADTVVDDGLSGDERAEIEMLIELLQTQGIDSVEELQEALGV